MRNNPIKKLSKQISCVCLAHIDKSSVRTLYKVSSQLSLHACPSYVTSTRKNQIQLAATIDEEGIKTCVSGLLAGSGVMSIGFLQDLELSYGRE